MIKLGRTERKSREGSGLGGISSPVWVGPVPPALPARPAGYGDVRTLVPALVLAPAARAHGRAHAARYRPQPHRPQARSAPPFLAALKRCALEGSWNCWVLHAQGDGARRSASAYDPALVPAPAAMGDHVFGVLTQCTGIQARKVADKGKVGVRSPEEFSRLVRVSGPAGRVMQKLIDDGAP